MANVTQKKFLAEIVRLKKIIEVATWQRNGVAKYKIEAYTPLLLQCENATTQKEKNELYSKLLTIK